MRSTDIFRLNERLKSFRKLTLGRSILSKSITNTTHTLPYPSIIQ